MNNRRAVSRLVLATFLAGALVPLAATPSGAAPGCVDETPPTDPILHLPTGDGCDDDTPPDTTLTASSTPNAQGYLNASTMSFTLGTQVGDGDPGPFGLECRLTGPAQAHDWRICASPVTYAGLPDGSYTFAARAVDLGDRGRTPDVPLLPPTTPDVPDEDPTPAALTWTQDTQVPFVFVTGSGYDDDTPTQPVITTDTVPIRLNSNEPGSSFECQDNGRAVACSAGRWELEDPRAGRHSFTARTIDRAGNASAWSEPIKFFVPRNLTRQRGWTKVEKSGYFHGDALRATHRGARLVLPRTKVGELRLLAATGPGYGKVRMRVGHRDWHVVDLAGRRADLVQHVVLDRYSGTRAGRIVIETLSNKTVVVDAVVARSNRFPPGHRP